LSLPVKVLDGANSIGGTKILLEFDNHGLLLDFGLNFKRFGLYYEEFIKPRTALGIHDFWDLDLIPHKSEFYRKDFVCHDLHDDEPINLESIDGVVLSHAHADHYGCLGLLKPEIPMICSSTSYSILRAIQDSGRTEFYQQTCYLSDYVEKGCRGHNVLSSAGGSHQGRDLVISSNDKDNITELCKRKANPATGKKPMNPGDISNLNEGKISWNLTQYPVDHSILGACASKIELDRGNVLYTGDIRKSGSHSELVDEFIASVRNPRPWILIIEGTQVTREEECLTSEVECKDNCEALIEQNDEDLVIADFSPRNVERLISFSEISETCGRTLVITQKDAYLLDCINVTDSTIPLPSDSILIYNDLKSTEGGWEKWLYKKYSKYYINGRDISESPSNYIVAFSYWDIKSLLDIKPHGGLYLYSSSEPFSEEQQIDLDRLFNWIGMFGMEIEGLEKINKDWYIIPGYHCSGHATPTQLDEIVRALNPEIIIPVHTQDRTWFTRFDDISEVVV